jgi:hypothetical protein
MIFGLTVAVIGMAALLGWSEIACGRRIAALEVRASELKARVKALEDGSEYRALRAEVDHLKQVLVDHLQAIGATSSDRDPSE